MSESNGSFPETFVPNRPSTVIITFDRYEVGTTRDHEQKVIAVGEIDGRERSLWLLGTALKSQFRKTDPEPGEELTISFASAKTKSANAREYWDDRVVAHDRPVEQITTDHPLFRDEEVDDHGTVIGY